MFILSLHFSCIAWHIWVSSTRQTSTAARRVAGGGVLLKVGVYFPHQWKSRSPNHKSPWLTSLKLWFGLTATKKAWFKALNKDHCLKVRMCVTSFNLTWWQISGSMICLFGVCSLLSSTCHELGNPTTQHNKDMILGADGTRCQILSYFVVFAHVLRYLPPSQSWQHMSPA